MPWGEGGRVPVFPASHTLGGLCRLWVVVGGRKEFPISGLLLPGIEFLHRGVKKNEICRQSAPGRYCGFGLGPGGGSLSCQPCLPGVEQIVAQVS